MKKILIMIILAASSVITVQAQIYRGSSNSMVVENLNEKYCSGIFKVTDATYIDLLNENQTAQGYTNILDWLEGRIAGLEVFVTYGRTRVPRIRGSVAKIYVDEIAVEPSYLNLLPVNDIAMIKIIKGPSASIFGAGGVIAIYTIKGDDEDEE